jgi:hypothetical protein
MYGTPVAPADRFRRCVVPSNLLECDERARSPSWDAQRGLPGVSLLPVWRSARRHHAQAGAPRRTLPSDDAAKTRRSPGVVLVASVQLLILITSATFVATMVRSFNSLNPVKARKVPRPIMRRGRITSVAARASWTPLPEGPKRSEPARCSCPETHTLSVRVHFPLPRA